MSWDQIELSAKSVLRHKAQLAMMVLDPIMIGLGAKKNSKGKSSKRVRQKSDKITAEEKDHRRIVQMQMMGFPLKEI